MSSKQSCRFQRELVPKMLLILELQIEMTQSPFTLWFLQQMLLGYLEETSRALSANLNAQQSEARPERLATHTQRHDPDSVTPGGGRGGGGGLGAGQAVPAMRNL